MKHSMSTFIQWEAEKAEFQQPKLHVQEAFEGLKNTDCKDLVETEKLVRVSVWCLCLYVCMGKDTKYSYPPA